MIILMVIVIDDDFLLYQNPLLAQILSLRIPSEMEVAPPYKTLKLAPELV